MNISVICPTYNSSNFVEKALNSILNQNYFHFEVIISDDGSTDDTLKILENFKIKFLKNNIEFKIIQNIHKGPGAARNEAIKVSKYDWLAFIDSDDFWEKNKLNIVSQLAEKYTNINCILHRQYFKSKKGKIKLHNYDKYFNPNKKVFNQLFKSNFIAMSSIVIKKQLILKYGGFDESLQNAQDYDLWLKVGDELNIFIIKDYLGTNVERENNITSRPYRYRLKNILKILFKYRKKVNYFIFIYKVLRSLISFQWFK